MKFIGEAGEWREVAAPVLWVHAVLSGTCAGAVWLLATPIAAALGEPRLAAYLRLFAVDIPIFSLAHAHRHILVGLGGFSARAWGSATRWVVRLFLVAVLVAMVLSISGAILGSIGGSLAKLLVVRIYVRPPLVWRPAFPVRVLLTYAVPLFVSGISLRLFDRLDIFALKILGGTAAQVGIYASAQNLTLVAGILALSFSPLLLSTLSQALARGDVHQARATGRDAMRLVLALLPISGMAAGAAPGIVDWLRPG